MSVQSKTMLARLLSTENITIRVDVNATTASFDVKDRILTIPRWALDNEAVTDMMTGHEVGHAIWTGFEDWAKAINKDGLHKGILNVVEDARIEKKIKRKYPGIIKDFISAYRTLADQNFFFEDGQNIEQMNIVDRINLHCKLGATFGIPFKNPSEEKLVLMVEACESWRDVTKTTRALMDHVLENIEEMWGESDIDYNGDSFNMDSDDSDGGIPIPGNGYDNNEDENDNGESDTTKQTGGDSDEEDSDGEFDPRFGDDDFADELPDDLVETQGQFDRMLDNLINPNSDGREAFVYFTLPDPNLKGMVVPYKRVLRELPKIMDEVLSPTPGNAAYSARHSAVDMDYQKFRRQSQKIINYMAKEFDRKKAASEYRKESVAKTGVLDVNKLFSYKYNDDLFLRNTIKPDGKNHGMVMLLDWSASMTPHLYDTMKQIINLMWFCQKINIPFEVYAFTNSYHNTAWHKAMRDDEVDLDEAAKLHMPDVWDLKEGNGTLHNDVCLLNIMSSRMSAKQSALMAKTLFKFSYCQRSGRGAFGPYEMSSTPLVEALVGIQKILPNFINKYGIDICNLMILTDGECNTAMDSVYSESSMNRRVGYNRSRAIRGYYNRKSTFLEDPITKKQYSLGEFTSMSDGYAYEGNIQTRAIIQMMKDRHNLNVVGIFLDGNAQGRRLTMRTLELMIGQRYFNKAAHKEARSHCRKHGFAPIKTISYDEFYIVPVGTIREDGGELNIEEGMSVGKMKAVFAKNQKTKFGNKMLVNRMTDIIAV